MLPSREPTGCEEFDRARELMAEQREDEALDWFEIALEATDDEAIRASAAAHVAGLLLGFGRPWEVADFATKVREYSRVSALGDMLEAAACVQLGDSTGALQLLGSEGTLVAPRDAWFRCSVAGMYAARVRALVMAGRHDDAHRELKRSLRGLADAPELWETVATLVASGEIEAKSYLDALAPARVLDVFGWIAGAPAAGLDGIAEGLWTRVPGDHRVLAAVSLCAWRLDPERALVWSVRLLEAGVTDRSPLLERAEMVQVEAADRVVAACVGFELDEGRARVALETATSQLAEGELAQQFLACLDRETRLADSFVVAASTTTVRCLIVANVLVHRGHVEEAFAVLLEGLQLPTADDLTPSVFNEHLPKPSRDMLAQVARRRSDEEVADMLLSVPA